MEQTRSTQQQIPEAELNRFRKEWNAMSLADRSGFNEDFELFAFFKADIPGFKIKSASYLR